MGVNHLLAQYDDVEATAQTLQQAKIDTLLSTIGVRNKKASEAQINLIRSSHISSTTRRFIACVFGTSRKIHTRCSGGAGKTYLSYTRVVNGLFLDYYGMPHWKTSVHPWLNVVNMEKRWAVILGDGSAKADFITSQTLQYL
ncbi:unnamed protein product [Clonostachys rosea f. rosea IK726]|uniref:Uncharacterized protein n=1 Tax=Clonostachys rosea f. rosea IK726 TaxID=1349383 RepID=A0ACA9UDE1_BIOOC|nr:unnamed protein product [Clonostachys rosea f. rosea IK726]